MRALLTDTIRQNATHTYTNSGDTLCIAMR
jgi:hypothetical protein